MKDLWSHKAEVLTLHIGRLTINQMPWCSGLGLRQLPCFVSLGLLLVPDYSDGLVKRARRQTQWHNEAQLMVSAPSAQHVPLGQPPNIKLHILIVECLRNDQKVIFRSIAVVTSYSDYEPAQPKWHYPTRFVVLMCCIIQTTALTITPWFWKTLNQSLDGI